MAVRDEQPLKETRRGPPWRETLSQAPAVLLGGGLLIYGYLSICYDTFYGSLGVDPNDVGLSYVGGLGFLATVRADGGPRLHPMCPLVTDDALVGFLQPSPKRGDLHRDGRYALHSFPADANEDAFYLSGRAVLIHDRERRQVATAQFLAERKLTTTPEDFEAQDLFEFYLERCLWTATSGHGDWNPRHTIWRSS
jgi:hypothetical protein